MNILLLGALSWNPERILALVRRGHRLFGLWSRTMTWEQGPYSFAEGLITDLDVESAIELLRDRTIDLIYSLFQVYDRRLWAREAPAGVEDFWLQLRRLVEGKSKGAFEAPIVRHWGFDVHNLDLELVRALDGQIFCNPQKLRYWTASRPEGGCELDLGCERQVIAFMDSDLPSREFMNERFSSKLSDRDGEIHTVCVGRPFGIDLVSAARHGIHIHIYGNEVDDVARIVSQGLRLSGYARLGIASRYIHLHSSLQPTGGSLAEIRATKAKWVEEFSRYDAGWSYVKRPLPWPRLEDAAVIPNRHGTYLMAGLPIIIEPMPGFYRYDSLKQHGAAIDFRPDDYAVLAARLRERATLLEMTQNARSCRAQFTFDATIDALEDYFRRVLDRHRAVAKPQWLRATNPASTTHGRVQLLTRPLSFTTLFEEKRIPGGLRSRLRFGVRITSARARWLFAAIMAKVYVARALAGCQQKVEAESASPR